MKLPDRKTQPKMSSVGIDKIPEAESFLLKNKVPVFFIEAGSEELMKIDFIFRAGKIAEEFPLQASTANMMLIEGTQNYTAEALNKTLDYYGTFLNLVYEKDAAGLTIYFLNKHLEKILELCREILLRPVFLENELNTLLKKRRQWYLVNRVKVQNIASEKFFESIFGHDHPYGRQTELNDFDGLTPPLLKQFHQRFYNHGNMAVIVSGKIHPETKNLLNNYFGESAANNEIPVDTHARPAGEKDRKVFIEKKEAVQSAIRIGSKTIDKRHPDYHGLKIVDTIFGGYFGSRLMKNIREEKGYTYGISSSVSSFKLSGYKVIAAEVGMNYIEKTLEEIYKEIGILQKTPVEIEELEIVRNLMLGEMVRMFDGPFSISDSFRAAWEFGLGNSYYYELARKIKTIEPDEIIHLAKTYYNIDELYEIIAGSR
jgi:predicted Zn-dependent peptidase